jgi:serpin B
MHRTMVKVDEAGTKAAAATSIQMEGATTPKAAFRMLVDRPFVFAIHESSSDELLFLGLVRML